MRGARGSQDGPSRLPATAFVTGPAAAVLAHACSMCAHVVLTLRRRALIFSVRACIAAGTALSAGNVRGNSVRPSVAYAGAQRSHFANFACTSVPRLRGTVQTGSAPVQLSRSAAAVVMAVSACRLACAVGQSWAVDQCVLLLPQIPSNFTASVLQHGATEEKGEHARLVSDA